MCAVPAASAGGQRPISAITSGSRGPRAGRPPREGANVDYALTNAGLEGLNAIIQGVKKTARGFRNAEHFRTVIFFHCGGLDLYPHETR